MAVKPSTLSQVGPISGQMRRSLSTSERTQIDSMRSIAGTISTTAGGINGDVTGRFSGVTNAAQGRLGVSSVLAQNLEATGLTTGTINGLLTNKVAPAITNHRPLDRSSSSTPTDLSLPSNRMPDHRSAAPTKIIEQRRQDLNGSPNDRFPLDIDQAPAYIELNFYKYNRDSSFSPGNLSSASPVVLPLPENFAQSFNIKYDQRDQGFLGDSIGVQTAASAALADSDSSGIERIQTIAGVVGASFAARKGHATLDLINEGLGDIAGATAGMIPNPHSSIFFQGMDLRTFQWTWKLVPRSKAEAEAIESILKKIKKHVLPKKSTGGITLDYPDMMQPKVHGEVGDYLGGFRYSMVKGFTVNFAGEGASAFFQDGRPVSIQLGLEFQEVDIVVGE